MQVGVAVIPPVTPTSNSLRVTGLWTNSESEEYHMMCSGSHELLLTLRR